MFFVLKFSFIFTKFCFPFILMVSLNINNQKHLYLIDFIKNILFIYFFQKYCVVYLHFSAK